MTEVGKKRFKETCEPEEDLKNFKRFRIRSRFAISSFKRCRTRMAKEDKVIGIIVWSFIVIGVATSISILLLEWLTK